MVKPVVIVLPHSPKEFEDAEELKEYLRAELREHGQYLVPTLSRRLSISPGSLCLFMKDKKIVGEAVVKEGVKRYEGSEISPVTGRTYEGVLTFEPSSVRLYVNPLDLHIVRRITGAKLTPRFRHTLSWEDYGSLLAQIVKNGFC